MTTQQRRALLTLSHACTYALQFSTKEDAQRFFDHTGTEGHRALSGAMAILMGAALTILEESLDITIGQERVAGPPRVR